jgi:hypothetical protein
MSEEEQTRPLHCTADQGRAHAIISEGQPTLVECPICKKTDTLEAATTEAVKAQLQSMLSSAFTGTKGISVTKSGGAPRWVFGEPSSSSAA